MKVIWRKQDLKQDMGKMFGFALNVLVKGKEQSIINVLHGHAGHRCRISGY